MSVRESLIQDYNTLQSEFVQQPGGSFAHYTQVWHRLRFACVHAAWGGDQPQYTELLLELFHYISLFLAPDRGPRPRLCAIYTIFSFYQTQLRFPGGDDSVIRVRVTPIAWRYIKELYALGETDATYRDAAAAIRALCQAKAFVFSAAALHRREDDAPTPASGATPLHLVWGGADGGVDGGHSAAAAPLATPDELRLPAGLPAKYADSKRTLWAAELAETGLGLVDAAAAGSVAELPAPLSHVYDDHEGRLAEMQGAFVTARTRRLREVLRRAARRNSKKTRVSSPQAPVEIAPPPPPPRTLPDEPPITPAVPNGGGSPATGTPPAAGAAAATTTTTTAPAAPTARIGPLRMPDF